MTLFCGLLLPFFFLFIIFLIIIIITIIIIINYIKYNNNIVLIGVRLCVVVGCVGRSKNRRRKKRIKYNS